MARFNPRIICTYLYVITKYGYPPPARDTLQHISEMKELGFESVELEGIHPEHLIEICALQDRLRIELQSLNLQVPYFCIVLPGLSSPDGVVRQRNLKLFEQGCQTAAAIGSVGVLDNAPIPPYQFPQHIPVVRHYDDDILQPASLPDDLNWEKYWQELIATYRRACSIAGKYGLTYSMHPCQGALATSAGEFLNFANAIERKELRFNLDTANQFVLKENINLALIQLSKYVDYIHLSDNGGLRVEHLAPGSGKIAWKPFFEVIKQIEFIGHFGLDIGGAESDITDIDRAYVHAADWLEELLKA